jgi:hypothetical protein
MPRPSAMPLKRYGRAVTRTFSRPVAGKMTNHLVSFCPVTNLQILRLRLSCLGFGEYSQPKRTSRGKSALECWGLKLSADRQYRTRIFLQADDLQQWAGRRWVMQLIAEIVRGKRVRSGREVG